MIIFILHCFKHVFNLSILLNVTGEGLGGSRKPKGWLFRLKLNVSKVIAPYPLPMRQVIVADHHGYQSMWQSHRGRGWKQRLPPYCRAQHGDMLSFMSRRLVLTVPALWGNGD